MASKVKSGSIKINSNGATSWFKNVSRSLGYATADLVTQLVPSTSDFITSNADTVREVYSEVKSMKTTGKRVMDSVSNIPQIGIAKDAWKNAISDIKTGKIYNKDRQDTMFDDGDEFNFDDSDFGMSDLSDDSSDDIENNRPIQNITVNKIEPSLSPNNPMVKAMNKQTQAIYETAQGQTDINVALASNQMMMNRKMGMSMIQGLESINNNLSLLVNFQSESMTKYIGASLKYYDENLAIMRDTLEHMKKGFNLSEGEQVKQKEDPLDQALLSGGGLNLKGYMNVVKKNLGNAVDSNIFLSTIKFMLGDKDTLKFMAASPLSFIATKVVTGIIPGMLKNAMHDMDKSFQNFFPALIMKLNRLAFTSNNPILQTIGQIFGIDVKTKQSADLGKYKKDQVPFDGYTKKAITEVIPGYLRKILAALTGKEEMGYDYNKGKFRSVFQMANEEKANQNRVITNEFSDVIGELKSRSEAIRMTDEKDRKAFMDDINKFFINLGKTNHLVNPLRTKDKQGNSVDELADVHKFSNSEMQRAFRQMILSLPKNMQIQMFGSDVISSRKALKDYMEDIENNPLATNYSTIYNGLGYDDHITRSKINNTKYEAKKGFGMNPTDNYGNTSLDYLRDIKKVLLEGLVVYPGTSFGGDGSGTGVLPQVVQDRMTTTKTRLERMTTQENKYKTDNQVRQSKIEQYTQQQIKRMNENHQWVVGSSLDLENKSDVELRQHFNDFAANRDANPTNGKDTIGQWFGKFLKGSTQDKYNMMRQKIDDILKKPAQLLTTTFKKIDDTMYKIVFGSEKDNQSSGSFMTKTLALLKGQFTKFGNYMKNEIFLPLNQSLFGKEGLITKIKDSDFGKSVQNRMNQFGRYLFGNQVNGKREGGLFSDTFNSMGDVMKSAKYYFTGKSYKDSTGRTYPENPASVFGELKAGFKSFSTDLKHYMFGDKNNADVDQQKGLLSGVLSSLKQGFNNFNSAIFGPNVGKNSSSLTFEEFSKTMKKRAPKALATGITGAGAGLLLGGKLGLLGSLFLPGGPIGGLVVGTTLGFLGQSDNFKNWLFGPKDPNGQRVGGIVSKSTQDFLKKNRAGIVGGATLGAAKSILGFGLLPSFFLPGGPIGGAILGMGTSMLYRSEAVQKFLFGEKDQDGKRMGGMFQKLFSKAGKNNGLGNVGVGIIGGSALGLVASKMGIMGAMMVPGGPIGGAILGAAAGIALSSEKWKTAIFGEWDEKKNKRKGGLLGKFTNWFRLEVQEPLKLKFREISLNVGEWFTKSIANPFADAIAPIKKELTDQIKKMTDAFKEGWNTLKTAVGDVFEKYVGKPFGEFMSEKVMKPLKNFFGKILDFSGKALGKVIAAPFAGLTLLAQGLTKKHSKQGLNQYIEEGWSGEGGITDFKGRRQRGERMGLRQTKDANGNVVGKGLIGRVWDMYFNKETRQNAMYGPNGAYYASPEEQQKKADRNAKQDVEVTAKRAKLAADRERLDFFRKMGVKYDYDNFMVKKDKNGNPILDKNGNPIYSDVDVSRFMNPTEYDKKKSNFKDLPTQDFNRKISDMMGISIEDIVGKDGMIDFKNLNSKQKKQIRKAIQNGTLDNVLAKMFGVKEEPAQEQQIGEGEKGPEVLVQTQDKIAEELSNSIVPGVERTNGLLENLTNIADRIASAIVPGYKPKTKEVRISPSKPETPKESTEEKIINPAETIGEKLGEKITDAITGSNKDDEEHSHAGGIDNVPKDNYKANLHQGEMVIPADQANALRQENGEAIVKTTGVKGQINSSNRLVNSLGGSDSLKGMSKMQILQRMAGDVRTIAQEVYGQLDGVGSNVNKMRKMMQKSTGTEDDGSADPANKDRKGLMGRIRAFFYKPFDAIKTQLMKPVRWIADKLAVVGEGLKKIGGFIISIPKKVINIIGTIGKELWGVVKQAGGILKETFLEVVRIPGQLLKMGGDLLHAGVKMLTDTVFPAMGEALSGAVSLFSGALRGAGNVIAGFGKGIGNFFEGIGKQTKDFIFKVGGFAVDMIGTLGHTISSGFRMVTDFTLHMGQSLADFTLKSFAGIVDYTTRTVKAVGEKLAQVGESLFKIVTSPIKFLAGLVGKIGGFKQEVVVVGGRLDEVASVGSIGSIASVSRTNTLITSQNTTDLIQNVRIVESNIPVPVYLVPEKVSESFANIQPLSVKLDQQKDHNQVQIKGSNGPVPVDFSSNQSNATLNIGSLVNGSGEGGLRLVNPGDKIANSVFGGMEAFDSENDKEEARKKQEADEKTKEDAAQKEASRKTAGFMIAQKQTEDEKKFAHDSTVKELSLLEKIAGATQGHKDEWSSIFGSKGAIALALLAALPLVKKLIEWLLGKGNENRLDSNGGYIANSDLGEHVTRGLVYGAEKVAGSEAIKALMSGAKLVGKGVATVGKFVSKGVKKGWEGIKGGIDKAMGRVKSNSGEKLIALPSGEIVLEDAPSAGFSTPKKGQLTLPGAAEDGRPSNFVDAEWSIVDDGEKVAKKKGVISKTVEKIKNKLFGDKADKVAAESGEEIMAKTTDGIISKFIGLAKQAGQKLMDAIIKKFPEAKGAAGKVMELISKLVAKPSVFMRYMKDINEGLLKITGAASTGELLDIGFAAWGFTTGAFEAAHLFKVDGSAVDAVMIGISAILKAFLNVSWFFVIGILNDICVELTGFDFIQYIATIAYTAIMGSEKGAKLEAAEDNFKKEVDAYNKANGTKLSVDAYNDKVNKTVGQRIADGASAVWGGIKKGASAVGKGAAWVGGKLGQGFSAVGKGAAWVGGKIAHGAEAVGNGAAWVGGKVTQGAKAVWNSQPVQDIAKEVNNVFTGVKGAISQVGAEISKGVSVAWKGISGAVGDIWKGAKTVISDVGGGIKKAASKVWNGISDAASDVWNSAKGIVSDVGSTITKVTGIHWSDVQKIADGIWDTTKTVVGDVGKGIKDTASVVWDGIRDITGGLWSGIKDTLGGVAKGIWDVTKGVWSGIKDVVGGLWNGINSTVVGMAKGIGDYATGLWNAIKDVTGGLWDGIKSTVTGIGKGISDFASGIWSGIKDVTGGLWSGVKDIVSGFGEGIKKLAHGDWSGLKDMVSGIWSGVKDIIGGIGKGIADATSGLWNGIKDVAGGLWDGIKSTVSGISKGIVDFASGTWGAIKDITGGVWNGVKSIVSGVGNGIKDTASGIWSGIKSAASGVWDGVKDTINGAKNGISRVVSSTWNSITSTVSDMFSGVSGVFTSVKDTFKNAWKSVKNFFGGNGADNSDMPKNMHGGMGPGNEGGFGEPTSVNGFTYFSQNDPRWANAQYDHSPQTGTHSTTPFIKDRGCGPTSAAMVVTQLTGKQYFPTQMAQIAQKDGYSTSAGTSWGYWDEVAREFSLNERKINPKTDENTLKAMLDQHIPVVLSGSRTLYSASDSPFTTAGHFVVAVGRDGDNGIKINDPRGPEYSKTYDINKVENEAKAGWGFTYKGNGTLPDPMTNIPSSSGSSSSSSANMNILDLFGKMGEAFSLYVDNTYTGQNNQLQFGDIFDRLDNSGSSSSNFNIDFIPKNVQDAILKKTAEEAVKHETGGDYTLARNDVNASTGQQISPSIGLLQWRGNNAKNLMQQMYQQMPNNSEAKYFATQVDWNNQAPWSASEQARLQKFLSSNLSVSKNVENSMLLNYIKGTDLNPVYQYGVAPGKIKDPRVIAFLGDMANTGPGLIQPFMSAYSPTSSDGKSEFDNFMTQFREKSYWGPKSIYKNRINSLYNDLKEWDPEQGGFGGNNSDFNNIEGGFSALSMSVADKLNSSLDNNGKVKAMGTTFPSLASTGNNQVSSFISSTGKDEGVSDELLRKAIEVLGVIATNTGNTVDGIDALVKKESSVSIIQQNPQQAQPSVKDAKTDNQGNIIVVPPVQNTAINPIMNVANDRRNNKSQREYSVAKKIAAGRVN